MELKIITLRYSADRGIIDDAPLRALGRDHEVLGIRDHFFVVNDVPHLLCLVSCRRRADPMTPPMTASDTEFEHGPLPASAGPTPEPVTSDRSAAPAHSPEQRALHDTIRRWRSERAQRDGVPPYVVLTNRNLDALVRQRPDSITGLRRIPGIGKTKADRYGQQILRMLHPERSEQSASDEHLADGPRPETRATTSCSPEPDASSSTDADQAGEP